MAFDFDQDPLDRMAPNFSLTIEGNWVPENIRGMIERIEYEEADGMADLLRIRINDSLDPDGKMRIRDSRLFMPGNAVSVWMGYGASIRHIGRAIIRRVRPTFPGGGPPTMEIVGYTADSLMADSAPEALKETKNLKKGGVRVKNSKAGRTWTQAKYSEAVRDRAEAYGFLTDIDDTPEPPTDFIQKANMTDFDFIQGIANLTGFVFWVDGDEHGEWTLHFRDPNKLQQSDVQDQVYTFKYGDGDFSTLLNFEPELGIQGSITKLLVQTKDPISGKVLQASVEEENDDAPDLTIEPNNARSATDARTNAVRFGRSSQLDQRSQVDLEGNGMSGPIATASDVKIFIEDFSFAIKANRRFRNEAELAAWAAQWFRRHRENFMLSRGTIVGVESIRARQIHKLSGLGTAYDGEYQFTRVRHIMDATQGYLVDFNARRVVPKLPPVTPQSELQVIDLLVGPV